ncbi:MAG TPA: thioredoxin domain-containing protein [Steroidobacteraceae bacterium]|nr:thioredoxin domain-containing protein [Steroidobacteraceae bacterium]
MANHLISQTSPYLLQHAHNPVDWYPWGEEAFERARLERKPIHLSVGYAACHWCHVMAHESFEDDDVARVLNERFINIKVDREERPDVDRIYQVAQQMLTQRSGGWPLTMFLTHDDHRPFFGGTYFPKEARHGLPAFTDILRRVSEYYRLHEAELRQQNDALMSAFDELNPPPAPGDTQLTDAPIKASRELLGRTFDGQYGGFGRAPKFPNPKTIERLLRDWHTTSGQPQPDLQALYMATLTLRRMGEGGINDQLGGGFSRYSVDEYWMIPHFEKMLYDNGALLAVYAEAAVATGDRFYADIAARTANWAIREMQSPEGGYYSSFDADSEGHEGKFYVWNRDAVREALSEAEYTVFAARYGLDRTANFEGHWQLHIFQPIDEIARNNQLTSDDVEFLLESARTKLLTIRARRIWPGRDDKILTSWNALLIRGMAIASRALGRDDLAESATAALRFIHSKLWSNGKLLATYKDGRAHLNAYLDDYVFLVDAILELQQTRFNSAELKFASELLEVVLQHFVDAVAGGFYFTSDDHESLIYRSKSFADDATPAGNGIAAFVFQRMGHLLAEPRYLQAAEHTLRAAWPSLEKFPHAHTTLSIALDELLHPPETLILRGPRAEITNWARELHKLYAPRRMVLAVPGDAQDLPAALEEKASRGSAVAYVCHGSTCSAPIDSLGALVSRLRAGIEH